MKVVTVPGQTYVVYAAEGATITAPGVKDPLLTCEGGKPNYVTVPGGEMDISDPEATYAACRNFKRAALALGLLGGGNTSGLPAGYTRVEYLESTGTQYIKTTLIPEGLNTNIQFEITTRKQTTIFGYYKDESERYQIWTRLNGNGTGIDVDIVSAGSSGRATKYDNPLGYIADVEVNAGEGFILIGSTKKNVDRLATGFSSGAKDFGIFAQGATPSTPSQTRIYFIRCWRQGEDGHEWQPALDRTGTPCLYDLVTRKPYYNSGTGDFLYPGKEAQATTYSLRRPRMYAQMTEHGIRRLYHVPKGYNGTPEEYAEEHGFKILVETPQPEEGYWAPVWHDREDCIVLEWVETEPPAEELLTETE